ncbi:MAG: diguanylate cyclase [Dehalococcoidia bacterium]
MNNHKTLLKILVCDDDPADRKLVRAFIRKIEDKEIVLLEAGDKNEIEQALAKGRIDVVLMDIEMPEKSGMEWLVDIMEKQTAPVIMLTGQMNVEIAAQAIQEGALGSIPKSNLTIEKLRTTIDEALKQWNDRQLVKANQEELEKLATVDALTGLYNRRSVLNKLAEKIKLAHRYDEDLCLLLMDIDDFKSINDHYGHIAGDDVLETIANTIKQNIRETDYAGRYGGDELIIIFPQTDTLTASHIAERIRTKIEKTVIKNKDGSTFNVTVSQGISNYKNDENQVSFLSRVDQALYKAKQNKRNRVEILT